MDYKTNINTDLTTYPFTDARHSTKTWKYKRSNGNYLQGIPHIAENGWEQEDDLANYGYKTKSPEPSTLFVKKGYVPSFKKPLFDITEPDDYMIEIMEYQGQKYLRVMRGAPYYGTQVGTNYFASDFPEGVFPKRLIVVMQGGGGGGGSSTAEGDGFGGGGGAVCACVINIEDCDMYHFVVGAGGSGGSNGASGKNGNHTWIKKWTDESETLAWAEGGLYGPAGFLGTPSWGTIYTGGVNTNSKYYKNLVWGLPVYNSPNALNQWSASKDGYQSQFCMGGYGDNTDWDGGSRGTKGVDSPVIKFTANWDSDYREVTNNILNVGGCSGGALGDGAAGGGGASYFAAGGNGGDGGWGAHNAGYPGSKGSGGGGGRWVLFAFGNGANGGDGLVKIYY